MSLFITKYNEFFKLISVFLLILLSSCNSSNKTKIRIACAANLEYTMEAIAQEFEKDCDCEVEIITASTGQLTNQIVKGAPYDVFVSASMKYDDFLRKQDLIEGQLKIFATARLILWSMTISDLDESILSSKNFETIAIPNPAVAPVGDGAMDFLGSQRYLVQLRDRIVYGGSVSQVNQMIASGNVNLGITTKSAIFNPNLTMEGYWYEISTLKHGGIFQTCVALKNSENMELAEKFRDYLSSKEAKKILVHHGYDLPSERKF